MRHTRETDQETDVLLQSVALIGLGQSPRGNMADEITSLVNHPMETHEFGLLDGLPPKSLDQLKTLSEIELQASQSRQSNVNGKAEPFLMTQLRDSTPVLLSLDYASVLLTDLYSVLVARPIDLVVLMTTIIGPTPAPARATIFCDKIVKRAIETFAGSGLRVGVIIHLESQQQLLGFSKETNASIDIVAVPPEEGLISNQKLDLLDGCDIVVMNSITFDAEQRHQLSSELGKPVVHARQLIATAIREALERLAAPSETFNLDPSKSMVDRLRILSGREREIMFMVSSGLTNKEIAFRLGISFRTVEIHRARMMSKMGFRSVAELVRTVDSLLEY
ncbi:MAG: Transcriptional regulatory protein FixJ [Gammaproteobacteria bacterium]|nr:MAG: Transcriptional regulatory protein FixJ [Gammaproteobacteria bacterium]